MKEIGNRSYPPDIISKGNVLSSHESLDSQMRSVAGQLRLTDRLIAQSIHLDDKEEKRRVLHERYELVTQALHMRDLARQSGIDPHAFLQLTKMFDSVSYSNLREKDVLLLEAIGNFQFNLSLAVLSTEEMERLEELVEVSGGYTAVKHRKTKAKHISKDTQKRNKYREIQETKRFKGIRRQVSETEIDEDDSEEYE